MKKLMTLALAAGMLFGAATGASAVDFKAKGQWLFGFGAANTNLASKYGHDRTDSDDTFSAVQRIRMQLDAVASESLSGTLYFEIGNQFWGDNRHASGGGALGADGNGAIKVKRAYLDWLVPQTDLKFRMGLQGVQLPNKAGGSAVMDTDVAGVTASYTFNENVALTALWARPLNDNFGGDNRNNGVWDAANGRWIRQPGRDAYGNDNFLDNMDLFALMLDLKFDGVQLTPWVMYGAIGKNAWATANNPNAYNDGNLLYTMNPYNFANSWGGLNLANRDEFNYSGNAYSNAFWFGLPVAITLWDPLNIEFDINYGYVESYGRYNVQKRYNGFQNGVPYERTVRGNTQSQGWLAKALVEYKMDWGVPGIFGWYASGDDGNVKNGSERMPSVAPMGNFTSFMGDGNMGWWLNDYNTSYAGTWGIGLQIRDMSFMEDLKHTFRVAYWGGTNSPSMVKYMDSSWAWENGTVAGPYLTTNDGLLEFNLVNTYQIYENLQLNFELGYVVNMIDKSTWKHSNYHTESYAKEDMWKAQLVFAYTF